MLILYKNLYTSPVKFWIIHGAPLPLSKYLFFYLFIPNSSNLTDELITVTIIFANLFEIYLVNMSKSYITTRVLYLPITLL